MAVRAKLYPSPVSRHSGGLSPRLSSSAIHFRTEPLRHLRPPPGSISDGGPVPSAIQRSTVRGDTPTNAATSFLLRRSSSSGSRLMGGSLASVVVPCLLYRHARRTCATLGEPGRTSRKG